MITANEVADYILCQFREKGVPIYHLKLQKLVYYVQAWFLAIYDEALFGEPLQAWIHGAVQPDLYKRFRRYQWDPIDYTPVICPNFEDEDIPKHIDKVLGVYGGYAARQLELMMHDEEPWKNARQGLAELEAGTQEISHDDMKTYYRRIGRKQG